MPPYDFEAGSFYGPAGPQALIEQYGSPLYVYHESVLRRRCREMAGLVDYRPFTANFSCKANTNIELLKIIRSEGLLADAMSPGEIYMLKQAGYKGGEIFYIPNNVSEQELTEAVQEGVMVSVDSLSQLERFGRLFPGAEVAIRFNTGHGAGHSDKVITAGKKTKFGIGDDQVEAAEAILKRYNLTLMGINQHVGSLFMEPEAFLAGMERLLELAQRFEQLRLIDLGGGFGMPYHQGQARLDLTELGSRMSEAMERFASRYGRRVTFKIEPGRYVTAECGVVLGTVQAIKEHAGTCYVGTDIGFNVMQRVVMYDSYHELTLYRGGQRVEGEARPVTVVGNICESGDKLAENRLLPEAREGDVIALSDAGAYGYSMASTYNQRLRPAEVLIEESGRSRLIRRRECFEDLMRGYDF